MDNSCGTPVVSSKWGAATYAGWDNTGYGNMVTINDNIDYELYGHLQEIDVSYGQWVSQGQLIGLMGTTGRSTGYHTHLEFHWSGWDWAAVDPLGSLQ